ncbi:baseplate tail tube cap [Synechococcus phage Bellamy]|uniref:Tail tube cap n=1 Tax=Synechococcus phage Bellamy TaxID=2023996 RepID=A0A222YWU7_9CAUD|nr:baseplate tail tube cap [Synechococcus phage Bellamy]ASR76053.1 tail tube cap [Synechococcus phage Bellamy]
MAEFKAGTREQVKNGQAQYVAGDIVAKDAINPVGGAATRTKSVTQITGRDSSGRVTSSKTILYVEKNGNWQPAASKRDGKWNYSDPDYPLMAGVADAELQKDLANPSSTINKTTNNGIKAELGKRADIIPSATGPDGKVYPGDTDVVLQGDQNGADPWEAPDNGLEGQPLNTETKPLDQIPKSQGGTKTKAAAGTRNSFGDQVFPSDLAETGMDVIKFTMLEFKPRKVTNQGALGKVQKREKGRKGIGTVMLPVPGGITDQNNADWGDGRMNPLQAAGLEAAGRALSGNLEAGMRSAGDAISALGSNKEETKSTLKGLFSAGAVGLDPNEVLARTQGAVINPNLELLFKGPALRPFNFTFQMGARNEGDSLQIMEILRFFKQGSAPQRTEAQMLIKAPHTFQIEYLHRGTKNKFLNEIKECALLSVGVNYTPNNNYATFANGAPVSIELTLGFKELDPVFNDDYEGEGVGF